MGEDKSIEDARSTITLPVASTMPTTTPTKVEIPINVEGPMVAYCISYMPNPINYCIIANDGQMECFRFAWGPKPRSGAHYEQWSHHVYRPSDSSMEKLRQLINEAHVNELKNEYHAPNILDGTQQYLAIYLKGTSKSSR
jgi:hypothetical protein